MKMKPQALTQAADLHKHPQARNDMMKMRPQVLTQADGSRKLPQTRNDMMKTSAHANHSVVRIKRKAEGMPKTWNCRQTQLEGVPDL